MTKVPRTPRRLARRPEGAARGTIVALLALLAMAPTPALAGELSEPAPESDFGGVVAPEPAAGTDFGGAAPEPAVETDFGGVAAETAPAAETNALPEEAEAPGDVVVPVEQPAAQEEPALQAPVEAPAEPEPPVPDPPALPPEEPPPAAESGGSPTVIGNLNVDIRIFSPGDDGDVIQQIDRSAAGGALQSGLGSMPGWDWDWNWTWNWDGAPSPEQLFGSEPLGDPLAIALPAPVADIAEPLAPTATEERRRPKDEPPRARAQPVHAPAAAPGPPGSAPVLATTPLVEAAASARRAATTAPARSPGSPTKPAGPDQPPTELPLAGSAASTAPPGGGGSSLLLVVLLATLSLALGRAAEPAWMHARRLRSLIASGRLERPG